MEQEQIDAAWKATCGDIEAAIGMSLRMGLARQKGKTAEEVKRDFYVEIAKVAYEAGCRKGYTQRDSEGFDAPF